MTSDESIPEWFSRAIAAPWAEDGLAVDESPVVFRCWGDRSKPGVVLVHGDGAHSHWWDHVGPYLAQDSFVVALDLSGHGDSGRRDSYSLQIWAQEVVAVVRGLAHASIPPIVVGHSTGGHVGVISAAILGDQLGGLVLLESAIREMPSESNDVRRGVFGRAKVYPTQAAARERFRPWPDSPGALPYVLDHISLTSLQAVQEGWSWKFDPKIAIRPDQVVLTDLEGVVSRVAMIGAEFGLLTEEVSRQIRSRLDPGVSFTGILGAHHHVMLDQPLQLIATLRTVVSAWRNGPRQ